MPAVNLALKAFCFGFVRESVCVCMHNHILKV